MLRVGLTGGIACGKSRVLARLRSAGCFTIDLDEVSRAVMAPGLPAHAAVIKAFGKSIAGPDGRIDRRALAAIVFPDEAARLRLNAIVHPYIRAAEERHIVRAAVDRDAIVVTDGALLIEGGAHLRYERMIVVHCAPEIQIGRLMRRDGFNRDRAFERVASQMPLSEKRRFASFEVDTSGDFEQSDRAIEELVEGLRVLNQSPDPNITLSLSRAAACLGRGPQTGPADLRPMDVLNEAADSGVIDLTRLARLMKPPHDGPWYTAAQKLIPSGPGPETLTAPVVLWILARGRADRERVVAAAASLARLTHCDADAFAGACLLAEAFFETVTGDSAEDPGTWTCWRREAAKWGGGKPPERVVQAVQAARRGKVDDVEAVIAACAEVPHAQELASSLVALKSGTSTSPAESTWSTPLRRIGFRD